ncbi:MAG: hypothetical protein KAQ97_04120, partial [Candidatus Fermentibacteraceae bacterium]|nr:hypothetical protein [Candidatus Fermentibacteraceae bacterium]
MEYFRSVVEQGENGLRLDSYLVIQDDIEQSRSYINTLISNGHVSVDDSTITKPAFNVKTGQAIVLEVPDPIPIDLSPESIDLDVVFEDDHL